MDQGYLKKVEASWFIIEHRVGALNGDYDEHISIDDLSSICEKPNINNNLPIQ